MASNLTIAHDAAFSSMPLERETSCSALLFHLSARLLLFVTHYAGFLVSLTHWRLQDAVGTTADTAKAEKALIQLFNSNLKSRINAFKTQKGDVWEFNLCCDQSLIHLVQVNVYVWDSNAQINTILDNLSAYGFTSKGGATLPGLFFG